MRRIVLGVAVAAAMTAPVQAQDTLSVGSQRTGAFAHGVPQLANGQHFVCFRVAGAPGDRIAALMTSTEFDPKVGVADGCGEFAQVSEWDDDGGEGVNARLVLELGQAPVYLWATATGIGPHAHGAFDLRLQRTSDFPSLLCLSDDPARRSAATSACERFSNDPDRPVDARAVALSRLATFAIDRGDDREAVNLANRALALPGLSDAAAAEVYTRRGQAKGGLNDDAGALQDLDEAIRRRPDYSSALFVRGQALERAGELRRALADYDRVITLVPEADLALARRADLYLKMRRWGDAIADADRAAVIRPDDAERENSRCWVRAVAGYELTVARTACDRSLQLTPGQAHVLDSRALVSMRESRFQQAWADYDAAVRLDPERADYRYGRGLAALRLGRAAEGQADIAAAVSKDPDIARTFANMGLRPT